MAPGTPSFQHAFDRCVGLAPGAPAIRSARRDLSYVQLDQAARGVARELRAHGIGPGSFVGLVADRSAEALIGLLGIHAAGAAYVPLAPDQPGDRMRSAFRRTAVAAIVTLAEHGLAVEAAGCGVPILRLEDIGPEPADALPAVTASEHDPAYVLFTSGSTGEPKGVVVLRRNLTYYTGAIVELLDAGSQPLTFATTATIAADLGNTAIFPALASGGSVCVVSYDDALDGASFERLAARTPIDVLKITPSNLRALLAGAARPQAVVPRHSLICGGEALPWSLVDTVRGLRPECAIVNHYGPTETTVGALAYRVPADGSAARHDPTVPLGVPLAGARAYVLDRAGARCAAGATGELFVGGAGVAAGYAGAPGETAERFVPDPFAERTDREPATMYRTGDRVTVAADGSLIFAGRVDDQVKVRGFRVEPAEVEAAIRRHPAVLDAVVVARRTPDGGATLHAYVTGPAAEPCALRAFAATQLPSAMQPSTWTVLDAFALTANGKVDRRSLPAPIDQAAQPAPGDRSTPTEAALRALWCGVLLRDSIGLDDDFFEIGGHSLLATVVIAKTRRLYGGIAFPLRAFFEAPTLRAVAATVDRLVEGARQDELERLVAQLESMSDEDAAELQSG